MKTQLQIKTGEFEYIMQEFENEDLKTHSPQEAVETFIALKKAYFMGAAMPDKDFNALYDTIKSKKSVNGDPGIMGQMSHAQQFAINELKKSNNRDSYISKKIIT